MQRKRGTNRRIVYEKGTSLDDVRLDLKVYYEPVETGELVDGVPDLARYSDDLRTRAAAWLASSPVAPIARKPIVYAGGEVQTSMQISGPNTFTVMSVIKEIHIYKADSSI
jgi:hypothetical protein